MLTYTYINLVEHLTAIEVNCQHVSHSEEHSRQTESFRGKDAETGRGCIKNRHGSVVEITA